MQGKVDVEMSMLAQVVTVIFIVSLLRITTCSSPQIVVSGECLSLVSIPDTDNSVYTNLGDINIGGYIMATSTMANSLNTSTEQAGSLPLEMSEAIAYAVKLVNEDPRLLPNVTLGFVLVDDGYHPNITVATTFQFLPAETNKPESDGACFCSSVSKVVNKTRNTGNHNYDVIGAISPWFSYTTAAVSYVFSAAKIPLISCSTTSDELSDKSRHPYFMRVISPMKLQVKAMLAFIHSQGWSYISVLYSTGPVAESGYKAIQDLAPSYNICLARHHKIDLQTDYDYVVLDLLKYSDARVVILLIYLSQVRDVFHAVNKYNAAGTFIWICEAFIGLTIKVAFRGYEQDILGLFSFSNEQMLIPELYQNIGKLRINSTTNPWFKQCSEALFKCSFTEGTCDNDSSITDANNFVVDTSTSLYVDAVILFARAATKLLADRCPGLTGADARACIRGGDLLEYMKHVSFEGYSGHIAFDENGDIEGNYNLQQTVISYTNKSVSNYSSVYGIQVNIIGFYNVKTGKISYNGHRISWDHLFTLKTHDVHLINSTQHTAAPESVCSKPCLPGEYIIHTQPPGCCWKCRKCRVNERLINGNTMCEGCQPFTWPDPETSFTTCEDITVTFPLLSDLVTIVLISLAVLEIVSALIIFAVFVQFRHSPIIKASSRELSFLQLVAVGVGCFTVILQQLPPSDGICGTLYFTISLSFTWLYSALLVKSLRIYRLFLGRSRYRRNPRCISWYSQVIMTVLLISIQIILCLITYIIYKPAATKTQPLPMEKYVELACDMTLPGLVTFLAYNLVLVFVCSVFAIKTRKLPDNFNESWFILLCVTATLIIWLGFVPTYFTARRASLKSLMLSLAILLNDMVVLVLLFIPKVYTAVHTSSVIFSTESTTITMNQIAPVGNDSLQLQINGEIQRRITNN